MSEFQQPSVGRIVHFHESPEHPPIAALIVEVIHPDQACTVRAFWPEGATAVLTISHQSKVENEDDPYWCYPPRV